MTGKTRPHLRDCPFCKADASDEVGKVYFTQTICIASDCEFSMGYSVFCSECAAELNDEYAEEVARLWNGEEKPVEED